MMTIDSVAVELHILQNHIVKFISNTKCKTYSEIINKYTTRNIKCPKFNCQIQDCIGQFHYKSVIPNLPCSHKVNNDYCKDCIIKTGKKCWHCNLCNLDFYKNPSKHYILHTNHIYCDICNVSCRDSHKPHKHAAIYPRCPILNCYWKFEKHVTDDMLYKHFASQHKPIDNCQICKNHCKKQHNQEYKLHTLLKNPSLYPSNYIQLIQQYNIDVKDLEYTTLTFPKNEILKRVDSIINEKQYSEIYKVPNDIWGIIYSYLNVKDKYNMQFVCKRFNEVSNIFVSEWENFLYYGIYKIEPLCVMLCATSAKKAYCLVDKELNGIKCIIKINPHYRNAAPMKMYTKLDLIKVSFEKFKSVKKMMETKTKHDETRLKSLQTKIKNRQIRENELKNELSKYSLYIRNDSKVCSEYIEKGRGPNGENLNDVVEIMREMNWYFKNTKYKYVVEDIKYEYRLNDEWYDIVEVSRQAKIRIVHIYKLNNVSSINLPKNVLLLYNR
jgi:hypothetical protein